MMKHYRGFMKGKYGDSKAKHILHALACSISVPVKKDHNGGYFIGCSEEEQVSGIITLDKVYPKIEEENNIDL